MATVAAPIDATSTAAWKALEAHQEKLEAEGIDLKAWFAADADRVNKLSFDAGDLHFDLSKNLVTDETGCRRRRARGPRSHVCLRRARALR